MKTLKFITDLYFIPKKFIAEHNEKEYHTRNILMLLFGLHFFLSTLLFYITSELNTKQIIASFLASFVSIYVATIINALILLIVNKFISQKSINQKDCLWVVLPITISSTIVLLTQILLTVTCLKEIFLVDLLYSKIIYLYGITVVLYYLNKLYDYKKMHLSLMFVILGLKYLMIW